MTDQLVLFCDDPCETVWIGERTTSCPSCGEIGAVASDEPHGFIRERRPRFADFASPFYLPDHDRLETIRPKGGVL